MEGSKAQSYKKQIKISIWIIVCWTLLSIFGFPLWIPVISINIILIIYHTVKINRLKSNID